MGDNKDDDYIEKYTEDETPTILTDRSMYAPLVYGGLAVLEMIGYFATLSIGDKMQLTLIVLATVTAIMGLIYAITKIRDRFSYLFFWRLGFYSNAISLGVAIIVILLIYLHIIPLTFK